MTVQLCARCQKTTREPVVVAIGHGASVGGGTVYACPDCAPTFPKQRDPFDSSHNRWEKTVTTDLAREAFPLTPPEGSAPYSAEAPSGPQTRPWALRFARVPDSTQTTRVPAHVYDHGRQVNVSDDGGLLTCTANTHTATVPDGSTTNPPPLDEGPKD